MYMGFENFGGMGNFEKNSPKNVDDKKLDENEEVFKDYVEDLDLSPEDFEGVILDVGSGGGEFAKWAKDHQVSSDIYSLEPTDEIEGVPNGVKGLADELPFKDGSFDLVISHCAVPNVFVGEDEESIEKQVRGSFDEFLRVIKDEGEIRLSNVLIGEVYENQKVFAKIVGEVLEDLSLREDLEVEKIDMNQDSYEYDENNNPKRLLAKKFLIKIRKKGNKK